MPSMGVRRLRGVYQATLTATLMKYDNSHIDKANRSEQSTCKDYEIRTFINTATKLVSATLTPHVGW